MQARDIDDVLVKLEGVVDDAVSTASRTGLFAALYLQVTAAVKRGIDGGAFDDGPRMDRFDTLFANRYFEALDRWRSGQRPTRSWRITFEACDEDRHVILQHLLLGVNAHINLDLGIAAAAVATPAALHDLKPDFDRVNNILGDTLVALQQVIDRHSPLMKVLDAVGGRTDEQFVNFNVKESRAEAWNHAVVLASQDDAADERTIDVLDGKVAFFARLIRDPGPVLRSALDLVHVTESADVAAIIEDLAGAVSPVG